MFEAPFPNSYWVLPRLLLAGGYPGSANEKNAEKKLDALLDAGIRTFVNLTEEDETLGMDNPVASYQAELRLLARRRKLDVTYLRMPIQDRTAPTVAIMRHILDAVDRSLRDGAPTYVHCWAGLGRSGTVVGCFLKRHGIATNKDVIQKIRELRQQTDFPNDSSPHNGYQVNLVLNWRLHS